MSQNWVGKLTAGTGMGKSGNREEKELFLFPDCVCVLGGGVTLCVNYQRRQMNAPRRGQHVLGEVVPKAGLHTY